ncbi:MAG: DUF4145 domain-containing protein [Pseudolabrys sp.]
MPDKVEPKLGAERFSCPHCGAFAHQSWYRLGMKSFDRDTRPRLYKWNNDLLGHVQKIRDDDQRNKAIAFVNRLEKNILTYQYAEYFSTNWEFVNFYVSCCYSCEGFSVWVENNLVYPVSVSVVEPHEMMPNDVKADFEEAGSILNLSPRGAAALARLCIQKLVVDLGESGKNLNEDIAALVRKGLEVEVQQALDVVRVIGNNAVHPGTIDLKDNKETAMTLLQLVNMIVERRIAGPKKLLNLFAGLPARALKQIEDRDKPENEQIRCDLVAP